MVTLRDMIELDIDDYVRWFTTDTNWSNWDAPWEEINTNEEEEKKNWLAYYRYVKELKDDEFRYKFEIVVNSKHIGWVSSYYDLGYLENKDHIIAIGIDIPEVEYRNHGYGTIAINKYLDYLRKLNHKKIFIQTWSGNIPMIKVIEKIGFTEYFRKKDYRIVNNKTYDAITYILEL